MTVTRERPGRRELIGFSLGTVALLAGVALAVVGALVVPLVVSYVGTMLITGWRDPGPGIVQGCEKSLTCSEPGTFFIVWAVALGIYVVLAVLGFRAALNRLAPKSGRRRALDEAS